MANKKADAATVKAVAIIGYGINTKLAQGFNQSIAEWNKLETDVRRTYEELAAYAVEKPDDGIQKFHQRFLDLLKAKGWRHGQHIDVKRKIHPLMRTFDALHPAERSFYKALEVLAKGVVTHNIVVLDGDAGSVAEALERKDAQIKELEEVVVDLQSEAANLKTSIEVLKSEKAWAMDELKKVTTREGKKEDLTVPPQGFEETHKTAKKEKGGGK